MEVVDKAARDMVVADKVDLMPAHMDLFLKKRSTKWPTLSTSTTPRPIVTSLPRPRRQSFGTGSWGRKTDKSSATVAELTSAITAVSTVALAISKLTALTTKQSATEEGGTNNNAQNVDNDSSWGINHGDPTLAGLQGSMPIKQTNWPNKSNTLSVYHMTQLAIAPRQYITDFSTKLNSYGETTLKLDSHTDRCVLGRDALIFLDFDRPVVVESYDPLLGTKTYATVSRGLAYDDIQAGKVYHLVTKQASHI